MKNQTSENRRECIREASKIVHEGNVHLEIFSPLLRTDIVQKTVVWCPWLNNVKFRKRRVLTKVQQMNDRTERKVQLLGSYEDNSVHLR